MPQKKYILDTNAYIRLAQSLHPLLGEEFGAEHHTPYIVPEIDTEITFSSRLQTEFSWVNHSQYVENRKKQITTSTKEKKEVELAYEHMRSYANDTLLGVSDVDIEAVAYCYILKVPLVTDDGDMTSLAEVFEVKNYRTMEFLYIMQVNQRIDIDDIVAITSYWNYENDLPRAFEKDLRQLFGLMIEDLDTVD